MCSNLSRKSLTTKNAKRKQIVALSYAQLESKPQIKNDYYGRATQRANLRHKEDQNAKNS